jgi:predicted NAD/FAD-dependent oxidoreductase
LTHAPSVTVVGGGIAGLSAALRLAERGYPVKVYERSARLGGNLGSRTVGGAQLDVYPHMYLNWYHNFWSLLADATARPPRSGFTPCTTVWQLRRGEYPRFRSLTDAYSVWNPRHVLENIISGVAPPADMLVYGYANVDLLAERFRSTVDVNELSVSAFLHSRPYMTDRAAAAYNNFITMVWSLPSYLTSASDYQEYLGHCLADPTPAFWLPRGSAEERVIRPLRDALARANAEIVTGVQALGASCDGGRAKRLTLRHVRFDEDEGAFVGDGDEWSDEVEELVLAVTAPELSRLVRSGAPGERIVEYMPRTRELSRLETLPIPILQLYFNRRLPGVPSEPVGLHESRLALAFTDISQTWDGMGEETVLALSCSDPHGLPDTSWEENAMAMLRELAGYLGFDPGDRWGESTAIDWDRTRYNANADAQLFVNEIGTDSFRPGVHGEELPNLDFVGDFCRSSIGMTTIESAATSGVEAAAEIVTRHRIGDPVEVRVPKSVPAEVYAWLRLAWAPNVLGAKMWSSGSDMARRVGERVGALRR